MDKVPVSFGDGERIPFRETRRVVYQAIEATEMAMHRGEEPLDLGHALEVRGKDRSVVAFPRRHLGLLARRAVMHGDLRAFAGESQSDRAANAFGGPGNQNDAAFKFSHQLSRYHALHATPHATTSLSVNRTPSRAAIALKGL